VFNMMPTGGEGYWNSMLGEYATSSMVRKLLNILNRGIMDI
jgi:hypothetical protein